MAWDGGFFGVLGWAIPMLLGTIVYDIMAQPHALESDRRASWFTALVLMAVGYALNCLATLYDTDKGDGRRDRRRRRRLAGDSAVCERAGPIVDIPPGHSAVR